jgi:hypothetical protein
VAFMDEQAALWHMILQSTSSRPWWRNTRCDDVVLGKVHALDRRWSEASSQRWTDMGSRIPMCFDRQLAKQTGNTSDP